MRIPFYHEPEIPDNYTERGADHGARLTPEEIDNPDMRRVFVETRDMGLQEAFAWIPWRQARPGPPAIGPYAGHPRFQGKEPPCCPSGEKKEAPPYPR